MTKTIEISDDVYEALQNYADSKSVTVDNLVEDILISTVVDPMLTLARVSAEDEVERYRWFAWLLKKYNAEEVETLEDVSKSDESYTTDLIMAKVLKRLADKHLTNPKVLTDLYETFDKYDNKK